MGIDGTTRWETTWSPSEPGFGGITFRGAARAANDGVVVAGDFTTATLDLGGHVLNRPPGPIGANSANFVAALDDHGATSWAFAAGVTDPNGYVTIQRLAATRDGAVICGQYAGASQLGLPAVDSGISGFVARVAASGAIAAYLIRGSSVSCQRLVVADDGAAIVAIEGNSVFGSPAISVGARTFDNGPDTTVYVLNLSL